MSSPDKYSANSIRRLLGSLNSIHFRDEIGEIEYFGQKIVMLRRDTLELFKKELSKRQAAGTANVVAGVIGRSVGEEEGKILREAGESIGVETGRSTVDFLRISIEETNMGYGKVKVKELNISEGNATLLILNSFEAEPPGHADSSCCFFALGYLEGLLSKLSQKEFRGTEPECRGKGDESCTFRLNQSPTSRWKV